MLFKQSVTSLPATEITGFVVTLVAFNPDSGWSLWGACSSRSLGFPRGRCRSRKWEVRLDNTDSECCPSFKSVVVAMIDNVCVDKFRCASWFELLPQFDHRLFTCVVLDFQESFAITGKNPGNPNIHQNDNIVEPHQRRTPWRAVSHRSNHPFTIPLRQAAILQAEGNVLAAIPHIVGILCGHVYHFFTVVHPLMGAKRRVGAPGWMKRRLDGGDNPNFMEAPGEKHVRYPLSLPRPFQSLGCKHSSAARRYARK